VRAVGAYGLAACGNPVGGQNGGGQAIAAGPAWAPRREAPGSRGPLCGMQARPALTRTGRPRRVERPGDGPARPPHPRRRGLRVLTELLGHPPRATPLTEPPGGRRDSLPDLLGARVLRWLQR
jgi:hypothetical protein